MKLPFLIIVVSSILFLSIPVQAQPYRIRQSVISSGGGTGNSTAYSAMSTTGQSGVGRSGPYSYSGILGFWGSYPYLRGNQMLTLITVTDAGWNLLSVPVKAGDFHTTKLYPAAAGEAFMYGGRYENTSLMDNGIGYWLRFNSPAVDSISGLEIPAETISVKKGWNLIGTPSTSVATSSIVPLGDSIVSDCYGYSNDSGYTRQGTLTPGRAYWLKVNGDGKLALNNNTAMRTTRSSNSGKASAGNTGENSSSLSQRSWSTLTFVDGKKRVRMLYVASTGNIGNLNEYELPPLPPEGTTDIRFATNRLLETIADSGTKETPIQIFSAEYPLTVQWSPVAEGAALSIDGKEYSLKNAGTALITAPVSSVILRQARATPAQIPDQFALSQNFPNPWNPSTTIHFELPRDSHVILKIYDLLGQEVRTLLDENRPAGRYDVRLEGSNLSSGLYFYRITAGSFSDTRKMILLK